MKVSVGIALSPGFVCWGGGGGGGGGREEGSVGVDITNSLLPTNLHLWPHLSSTSLIPRPFIK